MRTLRDAGFDNVSLDLIYGIPGQSARDLERDLAEALALEPEHLSCYELEAKPGTRFTHAHGAELERQAEAMEDYFERVVEALTGAGYRWYETANFCRPTSGRDLRARHNLGYWLGRDYLGIGVGAVSTVGGCAGGTRRACRATSPRSAAASGRERELEALDARTQARERVLLGLRLDEPLRPAGPRRRRRRDALERLEARPRRRRSGALALTRRAAASSAAASRPSCSEPVSVNFLQMAEISERKRDILRRVVEEYVATGEPVGSKTLVERSASPSRRRPSATSSPSSSRSACSRTRTPPPGRIPTERRLPLLRRGGARAPGAAAGRGSRST